MNFKTSLDPLAKGITIGITLLFASMIIIPYVTITEGKMISNYLSAGLLLIYFTVFAFRPLHYTLTNTTLIIHRPFKNVEIDRIVMKSIELMDKEKLSRTFRTFGVGGLFGYFGKFANAKLGSMTWYATRRDRAVLITMADNKRVVLTPDNPIEFIDNYNRSKISHKEIKILHI